MKPLKPSMREKKRYLLVKGKNLRTNIEKAILEFIGVLGMSKACLNFIEVRKNSERVQKSSASTPSVKREKKDTAIISVNREGVDSVRASLVVYPDKMEVLKVSGTLKGLRGR